MRKTLLADIESVQAAIQRLTLHADEYIVSMQQDDFDVDGHAIREMQRRIARLSVDLAQLYRRLDS